LAGFRPDLSEFHGEVSNELHRGLPHTDARDGQGNESQMANGARGSLDPAECVADEDARMAHQAIADDAGEDRDQRKVQRARDV